MKNTITISPLVVILLLIIMINPSFAQSIETIERAGDILQVAIPLTAYGMTFVFDGYAERWSLSESFFSTHTILIQDYSHHNDLSDL